jgi:hypothetical protein
MIERYLKARWKKDGMSYPYLNCWGLVRIVRNELYGKPLLPALDINADDARGKDYASNTLIAEYLIECQPLPGALASAWRVGIFVHVGVVVEIEGRLCVLEIDDRSGVRWSRLQDFESRYTQVIYYDDKSIS